MNKKVMLVLKALGLAMGISVLVLNIMNQLSVNDSIIMLSIGLIAISLFLYNNYHEKQKN